MADHNKPTTTSAYVDFVAEVKGRVDDALKGLDPATTSPSNVPADAIRWTSAAKRWDKWDGSAWSALADFYAISISGSAAKLTTPRTIAISGGATGTATDFDGSTNVTILVTALDPTKITGTVAVSKGGTGASDAASARANLGLGNVDNTSDTSKPVSTAQQAAINSAVATKASRTGDTLTGPYSFGTRPTFNGATPWDTLNFNPASKVAADGGVNTIGLTQMFVCLFALGQGVPIAGSNLRYVIANAGVGTLTTTGFAPAGVWINDTIAISANQIATFKRIS